MSAVPPELYRDGGRGQNVPGYAVVRNERELALRSGRNSVRFTDVAALIDPTTVHFESLTDAKGTSVIEQNFQFDLVNTQRLLQKYVDGTITVDQLRGDSVESFRGTLLSVAGGITLKREDGTQSNKKVDVYLGFKNSADNNMGMPLPSGRVRVNKLDAADVTLEFIGEDKIDHTPRNENVLIKMGSAFDVVGERRQVGFSVDTSRRTMTEEIEVKLRNRKREAVTVIVKENLYRWVNWQITSKSQDFEKQDARTIHFPVKVAADGEAVVRYTVQYTW